MNDLQKVELDILKNFIEICDRLNLRYYLVCGSALGAAKYKGFIPWDDDIDVALPRQDYDVFCKKAQSMLPDYLFLQNHHTDTYYPLIFSKIRNNNTTFIEKSYAETNINHGIYIDVFPLDGYPEDVRWQKKIEKEKNRYLLMRLCCLNVPLTWKTKLLVALEKTCGVHKRPSTLVERIEKCVKLCSVDDSVVWCNHGNWQGQLEYAPREQYGEGAWTEFEGLQVRIPERFDEYLTQKYGDWRSDPPERERVGHHYHYICDTNLPYTKFVEVISKRKIKIKSDS